MFGFLHKTINIPTAISKPGIYFTCSADGKRKGLYVVSAGKVVTIYDSKEVTDVLDDVQRELEENSVYQANLTQMAAIFKDNAAPGVSTRAIGRKSGVMLSYVDTVPGAGQYTVAITGMNNCVAVIAASTDGTIDITSVVSGATNATINVEVNCENKKKFDLIFPLTKVVDGAAGTPGVGLPGADGKTELSVYCWTTGIAPLRPSAHTYPPAGWSIDPGTGTGSCYKSTAKFNLDMTWYNDPSNDWTTPLKLTGEDGETGQTGAALLFRGDWDSNKQYFHTAEYKTAVYYNGKYYITTAQPPFGVPPTNVNYWAEFSGQFESLATGLFFAEEANISGWIFKDNYIQSQNNNVILNGQATPGDPKIALGADYSGMGTAPARMYEDGSVVFKKGEIAGYTIDGDNLTANAQGDKYNYTITVDADGGVVTEAKDKVSGSVVGKTTLGYGVSKITEQNWAGASITTYNDLLIRDNSSESVKTFIRFDSSNSYARQSLFIYSKTTKSTMQIAELVDKGNTADGEPGYAVIRSSAIPSFKQLKSLALNGNIGRMDGNPSVTITEDFKVLLWSSGTGCFYELPIEFEADGTMKLKNVSDIAP